MLPFPTAPLLLRCLAGWATGLLIATLAAPVSAESDFFPRLQTALPKHFPDSHSSGLSVTELTPPPELPLTIDLTLHQTDLWDRLRHGFAMMDLNDELVLHYQQWYMNRPEALRRMIERSRPYLHHIVEELEARGMPSELALLPMVESSFNPMAHSPAAASGLWQFIPATGKRFKLEQNWWQDERRDVIASTSAALDYLQTIYDMHGDWHLALASYNWGEGAVKRAIEKNEARGLPTDYPNLTMPKETRHYVPKLQALKNIIGDPQTFARLNLPFIPNRTYLATVAAPRPMDVKTAARLANMTQEEFRHLNPSHNRPIIKPHTPVVLPADRVDTFTENLANHGSSLTQWQAYAVKSAERLAEIAARFGISTNELAQANGLPGNVRLAAGSKLLVPGAGENAEGLQRMLHADGSLAIIQPEPKARGKKQLKGKGNQGKNTAKGSRIASKGKAVSAKKPAAKAAAKPKARNKRR